MYKDLGLVVDRVDGTVLLSHLKIEDTVERLPSRHLTLSLYAEDVKAHYEALTPEKRKRLLRVFVSTRNVLRTGDLVSARSWLFEDQSASTFCACDVLATSETKNDLSEQPHNQSDPETAEHDSYTDVPDTRTRRYCATTPFSARFSFVSSDEEDHIPAQTDCSMPASAEIIDEGRTVAGSICSAGVDGNSLPVALESDCST